MKKRDSAVSILIAALLICTAVFAEEEAEEYFPSGPDQAEAEPELELGLEPENPYSRDFEAEGIYNLYKFDDESKPDRYESYKWYNTFRW